MDVTTSTEVWVATARLHQEHPDREGFRLQDIVDKAYGLQLASRQRPGVVMEASQHSVASKPPSLEPNRYLTLLDGNLRRLYREGDRFHERRRMGKVRPDSSEIPEEHQDLVEWYDEHYALQKPA